MPRYYFHLSNKRCVTDPYGTVLLDKNAAMSHALVVARELMFNSTGTPKSQPTLSRNCDKRVGVCSAGIVCKHGTFTACIWVSHAVAARQ
jgi:hypothetical protein